MKKILVAIDGSLHPEKAVDCARVISRSAPFSLTGIYVPALKMENVHVERSQSYSGAVFPGTFQEMEKVDYKVIDGEEANPHKEAFEARCREAGVSYTIHADDGDLSDELVRESLFADMLIISLDAYRHHIDDGDSRRFLTHVLRESQCPVLVTPARYEGIDHIVMAYDGSAGSVFAIKQFAQQFPSLSAGVPVRLVEVGKKTGNGITHEPLLREFARHHFPDFSIHPQTGNPADQILSFARRHSRPLIVMGSFARKSLAGLFHTSVGKAVVEAGAFPVFIAHR